MVSSILLGFVVFLGLIAGAYLCFLLKISGFLAFCISLAVAFLLGFVYFWITTSSKQECEDEESGEDIPTPPAPPHQKKPVIPTRPTQPTGPVYRDDLFEICDTRLIRCVKYHDHIRIPNGVTVIEKNVFANHTHLRKVILPDTLKTIEAEAFFNCTHLEELVLPEALEVIEEKAFLHCRSLKQVNFPKSLRKLGHLAFAHCTELAAVQYDDSLTVEVTSLSFPDCPKLPRHIVQKFTNPMCHFLLPPDKCDETTGSEAQEYRALRSEELPGYFRRTAYETLGPKSKLMYATILHALLQMEDRVNLSGIPCGESGSPITAIEKDYPEIFWVNWRKLNLNTLNDGILTDVYSITKAQRDQMQQQIDCVAEPFLAGIPRDLGDYEKAIRVYEWLAEKLEYDHTGLKEQENNRYDSVTHDDLRNIYGAFVKKRVVCVGYALAYVYLLQKLGVESVMRIGGNHAWTCAKLEGMYYHIDATWGDRGDDFAKFGVLSGYEYFGLTDDEMFGFHKRLDSLSQHISCNATTCCYYAKDGRYLQNVDAQELCRTISQYYRRTNEDEFEIKFPNPMLMEQAETCLAENERLITLAKELGFFFGSATRSKQNNLLYIRFL